MKYISSKNDFKITLNNKDNILNNINATLLWIFCSHVFISNSTDSIKYQFSGQLKKKKPLDFESLDLQHLLGKLISVTKYLRNCKYIYRSTVNRLIDIWIRNINGI